MTESLTGDMSDFLTCRKQFNEKFEKLSAKYFGVKPGPYYTKMQEALPKEHSHSVVLFFYFGDTSKINVPLLALQCGSSLHGYTTTLVDQWFWIHMSDPKTTHFGFLDDELGLTVSKDTGPVIPTVVPVEEGEISKLTPSYVKECQRKAQKVRTFLAIDKVEPGVS